MDEMVGVGTETVWTERREPWVQRKDDIRSAFACDLERILQSRSFRRLQGKTQVFSPDRAGSHRTRLTHSLEVAQIGVQVMHQIACDIELGETDETVADCLSHLPPSDLVRTIAMAHDLGHPPFGHDGEKALDACMAPYGGFEANAQTLRILARLEASSADAGANLTRRAMLGVLKYPAAARRLRGSAIGPTKGHFESEQDVVDWILAPLSEADRDLFTTIESVAGRPHRTPHRSLDCSIMDVADDMAPVFHRRIGPVPPTSNTAGSRHPTTGSMRNPTGRRARRLLSDTGHFRRWAIASHKASWLLTQDVGSGARRRIPAEPARGEGGGRRTRPRKTPWEREMPPSPRRHGPSGASPGSNSGTTSGARTPATSSACSIRARSAACRARRRF